MPLRLRQVVLLVDHMQPSLDQLRLLLATRDGDVDPEMAEFGLTHEVLRAGRDTYVELCAPLPSDEPTAASRFLERGGSGGYMVVIEIPDAVAARQRIVANGWKVALARQHNGNELTPLHPRDFGTLLEADEGAAGTSGTIRRSKVSSRSPAPPGSWRSTWRWRTRPSRPVAGPQHSSCRSATTGRV